MVKILMVKNFNTLIQIHECESFWVYSWLSAHPESSLTIYKCWMLPLGELPDAGQWDESGLLVQGLKKKELNWSVSDSGCMKSQSKSCEATQVKPQTKNVAEKIGNFK